MSATLPRPCLALVTDRRRVYGWPAGKIRIEGGGRPPDAPTTTSVGARFIAPEPRAAPAYPPLLEALGAAVVAGVDLVQLREPDLAPDELLALAREVRALTAGRALFVVNGDAELALAVGADGVHLPERGPKVTDIRARLGGRALVGRSVHGVAAARRAAADGADYAQVGSVHPTASHPGGPAGGLALVRDVRAAVALPLLAVGGITPENAADVLAAGADGVAAIGAILGVADPAAAIRRFHVAMGRASKTLALTGRNDTPM